MIDLRKIQNFQLCLWHSSFCRTVTQFKRYIFFKQYVYDYTQFQLWHSGSNTMVLTMQCYMYFLITYQGHFSCPYLMSLFYVLSYVRRLHLASLFSLIYLRSIKSFVIWPIIVQQKWDQESATSSSITTEGWSGREGGSEYPCKVKWKCTGCIYLMNSEKASREAIKLNMHDIHEKMKKKKHSMAVK